MLGSSFKIQEVSTAKAAMEASSCDFDVILLDIMFPDGNGVDICRSIKQDDPHRYCANQLFHGNRRGLESGFRSRG